MIFDLSFPATSANLGPAFDAAALAFDLRLRVRAEPAARDTVVATGRDAAICGALDNHLMLAVYRQILAAEGVEAPPLALRLDNAIPIGKGCGSSAAARLAGVALAVRFGNLKWNAQRIFDQAAELEGHPDNAAACWWGGLVVAAGSVGGGCRWLRVPVARAWPLLLVVPEAPLPTERARQALPTQYGRADAVANLQNALLLMAAFAQGRGELLGEAFADRWHQPYRAALCPLLDVLTPLAGRAGILGCALSGAGPSVLLVLAGAARQAEAEAAVRQALLAAGLVAEILPAAMARYGPGEDWKTR